MDIGAGLATRPKRSLRSWATLAPPAALLLFGGAAVTVYAVLAAPLLYPYWSDAPAYIEAARSLLSGEPLLISVPFGYESETQIFRLWPPGYPVLIAAVASGGLDAADAALWLTRLSVALLPLAVYWTIHRAVGGPLAVAAALLSFSSVGMFGYSHLVSSDPPFALLVALSLGFLLRGLDESGGHGSRRLLIIAGLLTALVVSLRNSGIAVILAEGATLSGLWIARDGSFGQMLRRGSRLALGIGIGLLPLLIWNLAAFGVLTPYRMPPSTMSVAQNVTDLICAMVSDMLLIQLGGRSAPFLAALFLVSGAAIIAIGIAQWRAPAAHAGKARAVDRGEDRLRIAFVIFAASYSLISACMLVAARSRYQWGESISERHVAQFDWLFAAALIVTVQWLTKWRAAAAPLIMFAICLVGLRGWHFFDGWQHMAVARDEGRLQPRMISLMFSQSPAAQRLIAGVPSDCYIVSNATEVIQVSFKRRAHAAPDNWTMESFANFRKPSVLIFVAFPSLDIQMLQPPGPGYRTIRDPVFVAFEADACRPSQ